MAARPIWRSRCDFRIGDANAQMFMPAARLGLHYYESGMVRYVTRLGVNAAKLLFLTARRIEAQEMFRIGYLTSLCEAGQLDATVDELVKDLSNMAPLSVAGMKRAINEIARNELDRDAFDEARASVLPERRYQGGPARLP